MDIIKKAVKFGNSAGVLLPRKLLGAEVKISVVNKPFDMKKEAMKLVDSALERILGMYILNIKPAEVLAISTDVKESIERDSLKLNIVPLNMIKKDIKTSEVLKQKLMKAEVIINPFLLDDLRREIRENFLKNKPVIKPARLVQENKPARRRLL